MKRRIRGMVVILVLSLTFPLGAQIRLGAVGGLNFADLETSGEQEVSTRTVFGMGTLIRT